jgi:hypothetical protein
MPSRLHTRLTRLEAEAGYPLKAGHFHPSMT